MRMPAEPPPWFKELNRAERRQAAKALRRRPSTLEWEHAEVETSDIDGMTCGNCFHPVRICQCKAADGQPLDWGYTPIQIMLDGKRLQR